LGLRMGLGSSRLELGLGLGLLRLGLGMGRLGHRLRLGLGRLGLGCVVALLGLARVLLQPMALPIQFATCHGLPVFGRTIASARNLGDFPPFGAFAKSGIPKFQSTRLSINRVLPT